MLDDQLEVQFEVLLSEQIGAIRVPAHGLWPWAGGPGWPKAIALHRREATMGHAQTPKKFA